MTRAKALMVLGTGSDVGKSVIAAGFCRLLSDMGVLVAPFKAQNMSNNSYVTKEGGEMGRAQVVQAECARVLPHTDMNPILLKPSEDNSSQVVIQGRAAGNMNARDYYEEMNKQRVLKAVRESYERLAAKYDVIVLEGAGSCAELNLKDNDCVNLSMAEWADARCVLVGDIDRGGIFASLIGTVDLLTPAERDRIDGLIVNKFRGDLGLFESGIEILQKKSGKPVWGVLPYDPELQIDAEDAVSVQGLGAAQEQEVFDFSILDIGVVLLPRMSNFTDFDILRETPGVRLRYIRGLNDFGNPDLVILPGTKATAGDLTYLVRCGMAKKIQDYFETGGRILGVCGGFQMLGDEITDSGASESADKAARGLGFFRMKTEFAPDKVLKQVSDQIDAALFGSKVCGPVEGYEIHMGRSDWQVGYENFGREGAVHTSGRIAGTYYHGLFDSVIFRNSFLNALARSAGKPFPLKTENLSARELREANYSRLATLLGRHLNLDYLTECLNLQLPSSLTLL